MHSDGLLPLLIDIALLRNLKNKKANVFGSSLKKYTYNNAVNKSGKLEGHSVHCISQVSHLKIRWPRTYHSPRPWLRALVAWAHRDQRLSKRSSGSTAGGLCLPKFLFAACCARWNILGLFEGKKETLWERTFGLAGGRAWHKDSCKKHQPQFSGFLHMRWSGVRSQCHDGQVIIQQDQQNEFSISFQTVIFKSTDHLDQWIKRCLPIVVEHVHIQLAMLPGVLCASHTTPEWCQPDKVAKFEFSAFLVVCDQDKTLCWPTNLGAVLTPLSKLRLNLLIATIKLRLNYTSLVNSN